MSRHVDLRTDGVIALWCDSVGIPGREIPGTNDGEARIPAAGDKPLLADFNLEAQAQVAKGGTVVRIFGIVRRCFYKGETAGGAKVESGHAGHRLRASERRKHKACRGSETGGAGLLQFILLMADTLLRVGFRVCAILDNKVVFALMGAITHAQAEVPKQGAILPGIAHLKIKARANASKLLTVGIHLDCVGGTIAIGLARIRLGNVVGLVLHLEIGVGQAGSKVRIKARKGTGRKNGSHHQSRLKKLHINPPFLTRTFIFWKASD